MLTDQAANQITVNGTLELPFGDDQSEPRMLRFFPRSRPVM